ncbi:MAG TPA: hypothetical protein VGS41_11765, partial [Chthonomonadales bacterium]|nr:hypothetical protein [Chthonomonadales bacterium]
MKVEENLDAVVNGRGPAEPALNSQILRGVMKRRSRRILAAGVGVFAATALLGLFVAPQKFTSTVSIQIQHPESSQLSLMSALGGGSANENYLGIIRSRAFAEPIAAQVGLRRFFHIRTERAAWEKLMRALAVRDSQAEGLLYIDVTLGGPPRLAAGAGARKKQIERLTAWIANLYAERLQQFMAKTDVSRDSVLMRNADSKVQQAKDDYEDWAARVRRLVASTRSPAGTSGTSDSSSGDSSGSQDLTLGSPVGASSLELLSERRAEAEADLNAAITEMRSRSALEGRQLTGLNKLSAEDPLLTVERNNVTLDERQVADLKIQLADSSPEVQAAMQRLRIDQGILDSKEAAMRSGLSTEETVAQARIDAMQKRLTTIDFQLSRAMRSFRGGKRREALLEWVKSEAGLRLKVWEAAATTASQLSIQSVSGKNRMAVIDQAIPPDYGEPGIGMVIAAGIGLALMAMALVILLEYLLQA